MPIDFNKHAAKGNELLNLLADDLQVSTDKAGRILRSVLHAIRNHLTVQESLQVIARLPMALKAIYVDQWHLTEEVPLMHHVQQFFDEVRSCDDGLAVYDFGNDELTGDAVKGVLRVLHYYLSDGEFDDIMAVLPAVLKSFIHDSISHSRMVL